MSDSFSDPDFDVVPDELKSLFDEVEIEVKGWNPAPGSIIGGTILDIQEAESEYGPYPLLLIKTPNSGIVGLHCFHTILKRDIERRLKAERLESGDMIVVKYLGERQIGGTGKNPAHDYRVAVKRQLRVQ